MPLLDLSKCPTLMAPLELECYPKLATNVQQPWNAAELYLIDQAQGLLKQHPHCTSLHLINDQAGSMHCALQQTNPQLCLKHLNESYCATKAMSLNSEFNKLKPAQLFSWSDELKDGFGEQASLWLIHLPKNFDQLRYWLQQIQQQVNNNGAIILLAGMSKHLPIKWLKWLEQHSENYQQLPQQKKARLIQLELKAQTPLPEIETWLGYDYQQMQLKALPGVFCRDHLDIGSRFLLEQLEQSPELNQSLAGNIVDLGCGNGLLGSYISRHLQQQKVPHQMFFCDDSKSAIISAEYNVQHNQSQEQIETASKAQFIHSNVLEAFDQEQVFDWIICNPPFHSGNNITTHIAEQMIQQSAKKLSSKGQLLLVANRHLNYQHELKKHFKKCSVIASNQKFQLFLAR